MLIFVETLVFHIFCVNMISSVESVDYISHLILGMIFQNTANKLECHCSTIVFVLMITIFYLKTKMSSFDVPKSSNRSLRFILCCAI